MKLPLTQNPAVLLLWHNDQTYGCAASPETNYQPLDESSLGRPYMFMHWTFNRGVSVITVGGEFNATSGQFDLNCDAPAPVTWAVSNANNGFSTASLTLDVAASQQSQASMTGQYIVPFERQPRPRPIRRGDHHVAVAYPVQLLLQGRRPNTLHQPGHVLLSAGISVGDRVPTA